jgi:hypothetical protein
MSWKRYNCVLVVATVPKLLTLFTTQMVVAKERLHSLVRDYKISNPVAVARQEGWMAEDSLRGQEFLLFGILLRNDGGQYNALELPLGVDSDSMFRVIEHYVLVTTVGFSTAMVGGYYVLRCV